MRLFPFPVASRRKAVRLSATICLSTFLVGCGEQAIALTSHTPLPPQYEVVRYGPKLTYTDSQGTVEELSGMNLASISGGGAQFSALNPADQKKLVNMALFVARQFDPTSEGTTSNSMSAVVNGQSLTLEVLESPTAEGGTVAFRALSGTRAVETELDIDEGTSEVTILESGVVVGSMLAEAAPAGQGSFTGTTADAAAAPTAGNGSLRWALNSMANAEGLDPDDWDWEGWDQQGDEGLSLVCKIIVATWVVALLAAITAGLTIVAPLIVAAAPALVMLTTAAVQGLFAGIVYGLNLSLSDTLWEGNDCDVQSGKSNVFDYVSSYFIDKVHRFLVKNHLWFYPE